MNREKNVRHLVRLLSVAWKLVVIVLILVVGVNFFVVKTTSGQIAATLDSHTDSISKAEINKLKAINADCIIVLGASVNADGTPSKMLQDRLDAGIELYKKGVAPKLLMSGDDGQIVYNEVNVMRNYAEAAGVPSEDIFLDHAGFSTYESVYRAKYIFDVKRMVAVTQSYHLYRTLYGCERMGIEAIGVAADQKVYTGQAMREVREILARDKDFLKWVIKPEPTYLGETIPISGKGISTH